MTASFSSPFIQFSLLSTRVSYLFLIVITSSCISSLRHFIILPILLFHITSSPVVTHLHFFFLAFPPSVLFVSTSCLPSAILIFLALFPFFFFFLPSLNPHSSHLSSFLLFIFLRVRPPPAFLFLTPSPVLPPSLSLVHPFPPEAES